jgi:hypothetical protein
VYAHALPAREFVTVKMTENDLVMTTPATWCQRAGIRPGSIVWIEPVPRANLEEVGRYLESIGCAYRFGRPPTADEVVNEAALAAPVPVAAGIRDVVHDLVAALPLLDAVRERVWAVCDEALSAEGI